MSFGETHELMEDRNDILSLVDVIQKLIECSTEFSFRLQHVWHILEKVRRGLLKLFAKSHRELGQCIQCMFTLVGKFVKAIGSRSESWCPFFLTRGSTACKGKIANTRNNPDLPHTAPLHRICS